MTKNVFRVKNVFVVKNVFKWLPGCSWLMPVQATELNWSISGDHRLLYKKSFYKCHSGSTRAMKSIFFKLGFWTLTFAGKGCLFQFPINEQRTLETYWNK